MMLRRASEERDSWLLDLEFGCIAGLVAHVCWTVLVHLGDVTDFCIKYSSLSILANSVCIMTIPRVEMTVTRISLIFVAVSILIMLVEGFRERRLLTTH